MAGFSKFDAADWLKTDKYSAEYVNAAQNQAGEIAGDEPENYDKYLVSCLAAAARARNKTDFAK